MVQIVNQPILGGGFKHYSGLLPTTPGDGGPHAQASVRPFHIAAGNALAIFRGDIVVINSASIGVQGAGDLIPNIGAPGGLVVGNGGGSLLGNGSMAANISRWVPGDTTSVIAGVVVGWGPISLYMAKNGFQYVPASTEAWAFVETDPQLYMVATMPTVPAGGGAGATFNLDLDLGVDVKANAGFQSTRFGISGLSLDPASLNTTATLPLRIVNASEQIGNDVTSPGFVCQVMFNQTRHWRGGAGFTAD
jgi:hypothetical protein